MGTWFGDDDASEIDDPVLLALDTWRGGGSREPKLPLSSLTTALRVRHAAHLAALGRVQCFAPHDPWLPPDHRRYDNLFLDSGGTPHLARPDRRYREGFRWEAASPPFVLSRWSPSRRAAPTGIA